MRELICPIKIQLHRSLMAVMRDVCGIGYKLYILTPEKWASKAKNQSY